MKTGSPIPDKRPDFVRRQYEFTTHIRDPEIFPAPADVEDRRMAIYRELLYNNVEDLIASSFPVLRALRDDIRWHAMVREFFAVHKSRTPLFLEIPEEFLSYLQHERGTRPEDPPWMLELAHYEWVELALAVSDKEIDDTDIDRHGDILAGVPVLSPLAWPLAYRWPVHAISKDNQPEHPGEQATYLVVYRDRRNEVGFLEINAVTARLLELLGERGGRSGSDILRIIAAELNHPNPDAVIEGGTGILEDLKERAIVLGPRCR